MVLAPSKAIFIPFLVVIVQGVCESDDGFSFKNTFKAPSRAQRERMRKLDEFEILERSSFTEDDVKSQKSKAEDYPHFVYYPFIFTSPPWNPYPSGRDREIVVEIRKGKRTTTSKPKTTELHEDNGIGEAEFLAEYWDEDEDEKLVPSSTTTAQPLSLDDQCEDIVVKIVEKSPVCSSSEKKFNNNLDFVKVKLSDIIASNATCDYESAESTEDDFDTKKSGLLAP